MDLVPNDVTQVFSRLVASSGLRRTRLPDLRHEVASPVLASGTDIAVVSTQLGHSSIRVTGDVCSHLVGGVGHRAADAASRCFPLLP